MLAPVIIAEEFVERARARGDRVLAGAANGAHGERCSALTPGQRLAGAVPLRSRKPAAHIVYALPLDLPGAVDCLLLGQSQKKSAAD
jgi:hypothetical protein